MADFPDVLETDRLCLRLPRSDDLEAVFEYASDEELARYMTFPQAQQIDDVRGFLDSIIGLATDAKERHWAIEKKQSPGLIGVITARRQNGIELGYVLNPKYWGNGYMPEAAGAVRDWAFNEEQASRVWAVCDTENPKSARVMEKIGMQREGVLRRWSLHPNVSQTPRDCFVYSIVS